MKIRMKILTGLLCTGMLFSSGVSVMASSNVEANAQTNAATKAKIEKAERESQINVIGDDVDEDDGVQVDPVEDGSASTGVCTIVYRDGADGDVFEDRVIEVKKGDNTPLYTLPEDIRPGYEFDSWSPSLSQKVTQSQVYVAQWKETDDISVDVEPSVTQHSEEAISGMPVTSGNAVSDNGTSDEAEPTERGTSQDTTDESLDNSGKEDAYADDVDSGDIPLGLLIFGLGVSVFGLAGIVAMLRKTNK